MPGVIEREIVLPTLRRVSLRLGRPVCASHLVAWMDEPIAERTLRLYLRRLEAAGMVQRPRGPRSGWMVA